MKVWHGLLAVALVGAAIVAYGLFAPEQDQRRDEDFPDLGTTDGATNGGSAATTAPVRSGTFVGADDFHFARGAVALHQAANGSHVLRFEGYDARDGPDVYLYLVEEAGADTTGAVEGDGLRLVVPGGEGDGRATVRGDFNVWLPAGTDVSRYGGVTIWCEQFDHFFGHAPLA